VADRTAFALVSASYLIDIARSFPTCLDRLIQQAIAQVLTPIFDPGFSGSSFGFRPGRSAHQAVRAARRYIEDGPQATNAGWQLMRFDVKYPDHPPKRKSPKSCGKVRNFIRYASQSMEAFWSPIENKMYPALNSVANETILDHPDHIATIKDALALHFIRSIAIRSIHEVAWQIARQQSRAELLNSRSYSQTYSNSSLGSRLRALKRLRQLSTIYIREPPGTN